MSCVPCPVSRVFFSFVFSFFCLFCVFFFLLLWRVPCPVSRVPCPRICCHFGSSISNFAYEIAKSPDLLPCWLKHFQFCFRNCKAQGSVAILAQAFPILRTKLQSPRICCHFGSSISSFASEIAKPKDLLPFWLKHFQFCVRNCKVPGSVAILAQAFRILLPKLQSPGAVAILAQAFPILLPKLQSPRICVCLMFFFV